MMGKYLTTVTFYCFALSCMCIVSNLLRKGTRAVPPHVTPPNIVRLLNISLRCNVCIVTLLFLCNAYVYSSMLIRGQRTCTFPRSNHYTELYQNKNITTITYNKLFFLQYTDMNYNYCCTAYTTE